MSKPHETRHPHKIACEQSPSLLIQNKHARTRLEKKKTTLKPWQLNVFNVNVYFFGLKILQNMLQTHHVHEMKPDSAIMLVSTLLNLSLYLFQTLPVCKASVIKLRTFLSILVFWARLLFKWFLCSKKTKHIEHTTYTESTTKAKSSTVVNKT